MSDLRKAAQYVVDAWKIYGTAESLRGWMDILEAALAQEPEPVQEPLVWEPVVRDRPWPYLTALTQREYDALHADLRWNYKKITPPKAEPVQEPGQDLIPPDSLFVCGQMGAHVTRVRLAEPAQEPVAWGWVGDPSTQDYAATQPDPVEPVAWNWMLDGRPYGQAYYGNPPDADIVERAAISGRTVRLLYTTPPQRPPLTDEEIDKATAQERDALLDHIYEYGTAAEGVLERIRKLCRAVERKVRGE